MRRRRSVLAVAAACALVGIAAWIGNEDTGVGAGITNPSSAPDRREPERSSFASARVENARSIVLEDPPDSQVGASDRLVLEVTTKSGAPVSGAEIVASGDWTSIGKTDALGEYHIARDLLVGLDLCIRAHGFVPRLYAVPHSVEGTLRVQLEHGWSLSGKVVDPGGSSLGSGIRVIALRPNQDLNPVRARASLDGLGPIPGATTNEEGEFVIEGLSTKMRYRLFAGGKGYCSANHFGQAFHYGMAAEVQSLTQYPVYGLRILLEGPEGMAPRINPELGGRWWGTPKPLAEGSQTVMSGAWMEPLLGLEAVPPKSSFHRVNYFTSRGNLGDVLDVQFECAYPGYEPVKVRLSASRAWNELDYSVVTLRETAQGFGSVTVWLEGLEQLSEIVPSLNSDAPARLHLSSPSEELPEIVVDLPGIEQGHCSIDGIPFGTYSAQFRAPHQLFRYPKSKHGPVYLTLDSRKADLRIPLEDLGSLRIHVLEPGGESFVGPLSGTHVRVLGRETDAFSFTSPPYEVPLLPVGKYELSLFVDGLELNAGFAIQANQATALTLVRP